MALVDDGDVIRGLGFVTLYAAYLEEAVDECVDVLLAADPEPRWAASRTAGSWILGRNNWLGAYGHSRCRLAGVLTSPTKSNRGKDEFGSGDTPVIPTTRQAWKLNF